MYWMIFCVLVVLAASAQAGYDFKDSDFNEMLFNELQLDFEEDVEAPHRLRRDAAPVADGGKDCHRENQRKGRDCYCCKGEKANMNQFEIMRDVKNKCIAENRDSADDFAFDPFDCAKMQAVKERMVCTAECMAKKFNLLNEDGSTNRDALLTHLRAKVGENKWKSDAVEGIVEKCLSELMETKEKEQQDAKDEASDDGKKGCNQCPLQLSHCIWREFVQACPAELQIDTGKCKNIRERLAKGDTSYLNKSFLHHYYAHREDKKDKEI